MKYTEREEKIIELIKKYEPITREKIAEKLSIPKDTIKKDLNFLARIGVLNSKTKIGYSFNGDIGFDIPILKMKVKDVMKKSIVVKEKDSVHDCILKLFNKDVGTIFVTDGVYLKGVVSRKDIISFLVGKNDIKSMPVSMIMTRMPNIVYALEDDLLIDLINKLIEKQVDCIPIVREENDGFLLLGRLSKTSITRLLVGR